MVAATVVSVTPSPLSRLEPDERLCVIRALYAALPLDEAMHAVAALAGTPEEVAGLGQEMRARSREAVRAAFPNGINTVMLSVLGIVAEPGGDWLADVRNRINAIPADERIDTLETWPTE